MFDTITRFVVAGCHGDPGAQEESDFFSATKFVSCDSIHAELLLFVRFCCGLHARILRGDFQAWITLFSPLLLFGLIVLKDSVFSQGRQDFISREKLKK